MFFNGKWLAWNITIFYYLGWWMWILSRFCVRPCDSRLGLANRMLSDFVLEHPATRVDSLLRRTAPWMLSHKRLIETPEMRRRPTWKAPYAGISRNTSPLKPGFLLACRSIRTSEQFPTYFQQMYTRYNIIGSLRANQLYHDWPWYVISDKGVHPTVVDYHYAHSSKVLI